MYYDMSCLTLIATHNIAITDIASTSHWEA